ncbi:CaiB/BaiF CoA transferase family protein [Mumia zhuanghuii]|uniref:CoA transferase n=1 Tax=Mumia zhuanghuii TaxID=2585211 RepID=A0A5C4MMS4_9ACTN|nr:CaiB/BaiF CoA-transferase family protein [Mumia zhuanghuii]TNC43614.1 CoA transferase [Mumia zhuanghuii]TNC46672.1 CoA transferase [Mumia zhuanghuii]
MTHATPPSATSSAVPPSQGPLAGLRVVEIAGIGPGPFAAMLLADLGADVLRVDRVAPGGLAVLPQDKDVLARGRRSVAVDLKRPEGVGVLLDLVERADVLVEGFRPGVAERLGFGPDVCLARNPRLVYGRMTGWGQDGPLAPSAGHDVNYVAVAGALDPIGRAGGPPQIPINLLGDFAGGSMYLVVGVLAALVEARESGRGQVVDAAIVDGAAHLLTMVTNLQQVGAWNDARGTNLLDSGAPFYDVYETSDGLWMSVGALEPQFYDEMVKLLELDDLPDRFDLASWPHLRETFASRFAERTQAEWAALFDGTDACVAPVVPLRDAPNHPHLAARGTYVEHEGVVQAAPAPRFSRTPAALGRTPSKPGADTREALASWGIDDVDALLASGAVVQRDPS